MPLLETKDFRHLTKAELIAQCKRLKVPFEEHNGDLVLVGTPGCGHVLYNAFTGRFFCTYKGKTFYSANTLGRPSRWRKQIYRFFYVEI